MNRAPAPSLERNPKLYLSQIFIPANEYGVREGYYDMAALAGVLRRNVKSPRVVSFIADMMGD